MNELGYNFRLPDINCALGISQLKRLDKFIFKRRKIAKIYDNFFSKYDIFSISNYDSIRPSLISEIPISFLKSSSLTAFYSLLFSTFSS